jgi:Ca2+-transporting ATPase
MRERPRDPREPILGRRHWLDIFALGAVMALSVLGALVVCVFVLSFPGPQATTVAFLTLAMSQLWHVFTMRDPKAGWVRNEVTRNPWIWGALCLCLILLLSAVYWPTLASTLSIVDPGPDGWAVAFVASLVPLLFGQVSLLPIFHADPGKRRVKLEASAAGTKA